MRIRIYVLCLLLLIAPAVSYAQFIGIRIGIPQLSGTGTGLMPSVSGQLVFLGDSLTFNGSTLTFNP